MSFLTGPVWVQQEISKWVLTSPLSPTEQFEGGEEGGSDGRVETRQCGGAAGVCPDQGTSTRASTATRLELSSVILAAVVCVCFYWFWFWCQPVLFLRSWFWDASKLAGWNSKSVVRLWEKSVFEPNSRTQSVCSLSCKNKTKNKTWNGSSQNGSFCCGQCGTNFLSESLRSQSVGGVPHPERLNNASMLMSIESFPTSSDTQTPV